MKLWVKRGIGRAKGELGPEGYKNGGGFEKEEEINSSMSCIGGQSVAQISLEVCKLLGGTLIYMVYFNGHLKIYVSD